MRTRCELDMLCGSMDRFARDYDRMYNKVAVLNERLGCRYHCSPANPARVTARRGVVRVVLFGVDVARVAVWDDAGIAAALLDVERCGSVLVAARGAGALVPLPSWG